MIKFKTYLKLKQLLEEQKKKYCVYCLINHTKKAIYFGVTNDIFERYKKHVSNEVKATKYWVFAENDIEDIIIEQNITQASASELAHDLEKQKFEEFEDYKVIQTSGI